MKFPNARKFFGGMRKRIYGIFGRKFGAIATPSKSKQSNIQQPSGQHHHLPMELQCELTNAITMNLSPPQHRKLPAELNQQIFRCFNPATQRKFICGLGWDFYAMFRHRLLTKTKRILNPHGNRLNGTNTIATITANGLNASTKFGDSVHVFAEQAFHISGPHCRVDEFPGTIMYYYEIKSHIYMRVGLSDGAMPDYSWIGCYPNSYAIENIGFYLDQCLIAGETHHFELPEGTIRSEMREHGNVFGCGLVLDPEDKVWIFFTFNGKFVDQKIPISTTVDRLFPTVAMWHDMSLEANFGDNLVKPFEYDLKNCPGLGLYCI